MNLPNEKRGNESSILFWKKYPTFHRQLFTFLCCFCEIITTGFTLGFTGILLPNIHKYVDEVHGPWLAGCNVLSIPVGIVVSSLVMRKYGRKPTLKYCTIPWIIGWLTLSTAQNFCTIFLASGLVGFSSGVSSSVVMVYFVELAEPQLRGFFASFMNIFYTSGIMLGHFLGMAFPWRISLALYAVFPTVALALAFFVPESPHWLVVEGRTDEALKNFFWLRGVSAESRREYDMLVGKRHENARKQERGVVRNLISRKFVEPFFIMTLMFVVSIGSGIYILVYYALDVLRSASETMNTKHVLVMINVTRVVSGIISSLIIKKLRRKPLFFSSAMCTFLFLIVIIVAIRYKLSDTLLILSFCSYIGAASLGIDPIPWIMLAEIFPQVLRDIGSGVAHVLFYFLLFLLVEASPVVIRTLGLEIMLSIYAAVMLLSAISLYFVMPETEKCTLQDVEDKVNKKDQISKGADEAGYPILLPKTEVPIGSCDAEASKCYN